MPAASRPTTARALMWHGFEEEEVLGLTCDERNKSRTKTHNKNNNTRQDETHTHTNSERATAQPPLSSRSRG